MIAAAILNGANGDDIDEGKSFMGESPLNGFDQMRGVGHGRSRHIRPSCPGHEMAKVKRRLLVPLRVVDVIAPNGVVAANCPPVVPYNPLFAHTTVRSIFLRAA